MRQNDYTSSIVWTGNRGSGTSGYRDFDRSWDITVPGKPVIQCSNDPLLGGDAHRMNPEDLLLSSLAACHMLWYLHLASEAGIAVIDYRDTPLGVGEVSPSGAGRFVRAILRPAITLHLESDIKAADAIHSRIHEVCFIARSVAFPVEYTASYTLA